MTFPGPQWTPLQIADGLMRNRPLSALTAPVRTLGAIVMAESLGYVWAHGLNTEASGTSSTSPAYLAEGHGLAGMDDYWIMRTWGPSQTDYAGLLMRPYWAGDNSFSQLAKDPDWNLAMMWEVYIANAATYGWNEAFAHAWTSYKNNKHLPFMDEAARAARAVGAIK